MQATNCQILPPQLNGTQMPPCGFSYKTLKDYILHPLTVTESDN